MYEPLTNHTPPIVKDARRRQGAIRPLSASHPANTFVPVIRRARKSVVSLLAMEGDEAAHSSLFQRFLSEWGANTSTRKTRQFGSGFIISSRGAILTNEHVVRHAGRIQVTLYGHKKPLPAKVVWSDSQRDIAVIRVSPLQPLTPLPLGSSRLTEVGEWAVAIGNPMGLNQSVTLGIVSGKDRPLRMGDRFFGRVIQTDAAINPGNSGGPLLNILGQAIGINTLVVYPSQSISFAIPIDDVKSLIRPYIS